MSSGPEEVQMGLAESQPSDYAVRKLILPKELDRALADFSKRTGVLPGVLLSRLTHEYLDAQGVGFSVGLERLIVQQEQFERAREAFLRNPRQAAVLASGTEEESLGRIREAFDPEITPPDSAA